MAIRLVLRLVLAVIFGSSTWILSGLISNPADNVGAIRFLLTLAFSGVGFLLFPEIATRVTHTAISFFNLTVHRLSLEIFDHLLRLPRQQPVPFLRPQQPASQGRPTSFFHPLILDTSALIDGRILDVAKTGFIYGMLLLPNFVLLELQQVADSSDSQKRQRGRRGFEIISELKKIHGLKVEVWDKDVGGKVVDEKLIKLAKSLGGKVVTTDFNLNKMASAHNVAVLNVNDLSNAIKTPALPGEFLEIKVVHLGKDPKQGVGYLPDGTMIVVEDGAPFLGKDVKVEVSRVLQGSAGRMIFGKTSAQG